MTTDDGSLKPGWTRVAFGDMATCVNERIDDPATAGVERYVGLEHLDSDSLTIRRWGSPTDVSATKLRFRKGDIIFGRRRVYQRKLAVADFDGICSAHAMVLRAKSQAVLPEFLPFFMQSDFFMDRAKTISVGSLSPTINWKTLEQEEFALPPLEDQRLYSKLLTLLHDARDRWRKCHLWLERACASFTISVCERLLEKYALVRLADVADVRYGLSITPSRRLSSVTVKRVPYLRVANVLRNSMNLSALKVINELDGDEKYRLHRGDVLIVEGHADPAEIGRACIWQDQVPHMLHQNHIIRVRCGECLSPDYLCSIINSPHGMRYFRSQTKSSSGLYTINSTVVGHYRLPLPPSSAQHSISRQLRSLASVNARILIQLRKLETLNKTVLKALVG